MTGFDACLRDAEARADEQASDPPEVEREDETTDTEWSVGEKFGSSQRIYKGLHLAVDLGGCGWVWSVTRGEPDGQPSIVAGEEHDHGEARRQAEEHADDVGEIGRAA